VSQAEAEHGTAISTVVNCGAAIADLGDGSNRIAETLL
jgi:hypothetical protein